MYFTPKNSIYFLLEDKLEQVDIILSSETLQDRGFTFDIIDADISFKAISSAEIKKTKVNIFAVYNSISLNNITLSNTAKSFVPLNIQNVKVIYSILNPLNVDIKAVGDFGELKGEFNVLKRFLHLELKPSKNMLTNYKNTLKKLSKTKNGEFIYDKTF